MAQFMLILIGTQKLEGMAPDQSTTVLDSWDQWGQGLGNALVSKGLPFASGVELVDNGEQAPPQQMCGYAIIQATDMQQALGMVQSHPFMSGNEGKNSVVVYELMTEPPASYASQAPTPSATPVQASPASPQTPQALPPAPEQAAPTPNPGELMIPHETEEADETVSPNPPPTQPNV